MFIVRERGGNSVPAVFNSESQAASFIRARIAKGTVVRADEAASWDNLHERFEVKRINHQEAYSLDGARADMAEGHVSRLRRAEAGIHRDVAGSYLLSYEEPPWREDNRKVSTGDQVNGRASPTSVPDARNRPTPRREGFAQNSRSAPQKSVTDHRPAPQRALG